ncbi:MAG: branched-chain amino acid transferase [Alphaproteobacteria bacterium]|nr:branched-chain amino acid transferase [Alphaproteobacteria bacterium]
MLSEILRVPDHLSVANADMSRARAYIDGAIVPLAEAKISIRDYGLMYADMTYDVLHTWKRGFFRLDDHLDRFMVSLRGLRLDPGLSRGDIHATLAELVRQSGLADTLVYFACTRGVAPPGTRDPALCRNNFFACVTPLVLRGQPAEMRRGLNAMMSSKVRRIPTDSVNPVWKNSHWGDLTRALFLAKDEGYDAVFLLDHEGNVTEGPGYNVVAVIDGTLVSPAGGVLEGISRKTMMEIADLLHIPNRLDTLTPEALRDADEIFITATSCGLFPVTRIDGRILGNGAPGPVTTRLLNTYYLKKDEGWHITPID